MFSIFPDYEYKTITEIPEEIFTGKKLLIFDVDNTLFYPETMRIREDILLWFSSLRKKYHCICVSNSLTIKERKQGIEKILTCSIFLSSHKKPSKKLFLEILERYKVPSEDIAIIGDLRLTDVFFGNRNHISTILVSPLTHDELFSIRVSRALENSLVFFLGLFSLGKYKKI